MTMACMHNIGLGKVGCQCVANKKQATCVVITLLMQTKTTTTTINLCVAWREIMQKPWLVPPKQCNNNSS